MNRINRVEIIGKENKRRDKRKKERKQNIKSIDRTYVQISLQKFYLFIIIIILNKFN